MISKSNGGIGMSENKFPSEVIDLPSEGKLYPEGNPLREGKLEIKYMTKLKDKTKVKFCILQQTQTVNLKL